MCLWSVCDNYILWQYSFPVAELRNVRFSAYRTALKSRRVQKALCCECFLTFFTSDTPVLQLSAKNEGFFNIV